MTRTRLAIARLASVITIPLVVALPPLFWIIEATHRMSLSSLGRDQGIFQYVAWAIERGAKSYRDVRDVNGPLTSFVHLLFLKLGGADEHRFRILDLAITGATFAIAGACLPGIARTRTIRAHDPWARVAWAFAAWVVLSGQYLLYLFWDVAQRESFCDWFLLTSVSLQLVGQARTSALTREEDQAKRHTRYLVIVGALSVVTWFGKPTYVLFSIAQLATLMIDREMALTRAKRLIAFAIGGVVGAATQILFLLRCGDLRSFVHITFVEVPAMYRFIWPRSASEILTDTGPLAIATIGLATTAVMLALIARGDVPRRALAIALMPICGLVSVIAQKKGFTYHFHPVTLGTSLIWLLALAWLVERSRAVSRSHTRIPRLVPIAAAAVLAFRIASSLQSSPHLQNTWILAEGATTELRNGSEYLTNFRTSDYFPWELRLAADYLRRHTRPEDRVQTYGMDPYVLFLAERMSATPYIYAYDLNADAALDGGWSLEPNANEKGHIIQLRNDHEIDLLAKLKDAPPAAFVFFDKAPLISWKDSAWLDFASHSPVSAHWVEAHYRPSAQFGELHVWMRDDLEEAIGVNVDAKPGRD